MLNLGDTVTWRYRITGNLDDRGQCAVYVVEDTETGRPGALTALPSAAAATPALHSRFEREVRACAQLRGHHVAALIDVGRDAETGVPFVIRELLEGESFDTRIDRLGPPPPPKARSLILELCDALAEAHNAGLVHGDVRPRHVFVAQESERQRVVKLLGFGIAPLLRDVRPQDAPEELGVLAWRAPELRTRGMIPTPAVDVWAIGLIAYFVLTGRVFWRSASDSGESAAALLREMLVDEVPRASARAAEHGRTLPAGFDDWFALCVNLDPSLRYADAKACGDAFAELYAPSAPDFLGAAHVAADPAQSLKSSRAVQQPQAGDASPESDAVTGQPVGTGDVGDTLATKRPPPKRGSRALGIPAWLVAAGAILTTTTIAGLVMWRNAGRKSEAYRRPVEPSVEEKPPASRDFLAVDAVRGRNWFVTAEVSEEFARHRHHLHIAEEGGRITRIERVDPTGMVQETRSIAYRSDGGWQETLKDSAGTLVEVVTIDADGTERRRARNGSPFISGCSALRRTYTDGNVAEVACLDAAGHLIIDSNGCQLVHFEWDASHRETAERCLQEGGTVSLDRYGAHLWRFAYDDQGRLVERATFDADGRAMLDDQDGCARKRFIFDDAGNRVTETCIGVSGLAVAFNGEEAATKKWTFDQHGCRLTEEYAANDGQPVAWSHDTWSRVYGRDSRYVAFNRDAHVESRTCAAVSDEIRNRDGTIVARLDYAFDDVGQEMEQRCTVRGQTSSCRIGGGSTVRSRYDDRGNRIELSAFDALGNPARWDKDYPHLRRSTFDERGLEVREAFFDNDGTPALALGNVAYFVYTYDELGSHVGLAAFGLDDHPVAGTVGVHEIRSRYDDRHRLNTIELYDGAGQAEEHPQGLSYDDVNWPQASKMNVERDGLRIHNVFTLSSGLQVERRDCADKQRDCYR